MNGLRELWRTVCLMGFATRIYRDPSGALYLLDLVRSSGDPVRRIRRIPDAATFALLMKTECSFFSAFALSVGIAAVCYASMPIGWALLVFVFLVGILHWADRPISWHLDNCCVDVPRFEFQGLALTKASDEVKLEAVTLVRVAAVVVGIIGLLTPLTHDDLPKAAATALDGLSFVLVFGCFRLVVLGGWVINPDKLHFAPSTLARDQARRQST
ncbi:MAG TPA: hypothetical protein VMW18_18675 [Candidatus Binatia bacterium]|nr:hypothetical protein [Candidatus Binatia bacterium]